MTIKTSTLIKQQYLKIGDTGSDESALMALECSKLNHFAHTSLMGEYN